MLISHRGAHLLTLAEALDDRLDHHVQVLDRRAAHSVGT